MKFVLDTCVFVNPQVARKFGKNSDEAVKKFLYYAKKLFGKVYFYMPPSTLKELKHFLKEEHKDLDLYLINKPPALHNIKIPASFLYTFIEELRERLNKGLRVAEEAVKMSLKEKDVGKVINKLRSNYRKALRFGFIDSKEDFEIIALALELNATIVSSDEGILRWASLLGIKRIEATKFRDLLKELIKKYKS